jgi:N-formylglutamate amidohydrolase
MDGNFMKKIIFHIPHDGDELVDELMEAIVISKEDFLFYHNKMRDTCASLFAPVYPNSQILKFNVSRLLCDVERFIGSDEIMEQYGMGFCYEKSFDGTVIKNISLDIEKKTRQLYDKHHEKLDIFVKEAQSPIVIVDLHSFSQDIIVHQTLSEPLPDICIGYDDYLPEKYIEIMRDIFEKNGFSVSYNYPYAGSMVPDCIFRKEFECECISFMIEVNKECYIKNGILDEDTINLVRNSIADILNFLNEN